MNIEGLKKIRTQLIASFSFVIVILIALIFFIAFSDLKIQKEYDQIINRMILEYEITETFSDMIDSYVLLLPDVSNQGLLNDYDIYNDKIETIFKTLDSQVVSSESLRVYNKVKTMIRSVVEECNTGLLSLKEKSFSEGSGIYDRAIKGREYVEETTAMLLLSELKYSKTLQESLDLTKRATTFTILSLAFVVTLFCVLFVISFSNRISRPLVRLSKIADSIAKGHLKTTVDKALLDRKDETGALSSSFHSMLMRLNNEIENQKRISGDLKKSKRQIEEYGHQMEREKVKLEALLTSLGEGVIAMDLNGRILIFNEQAEKMFGKKSKDCFGKNFMHSCEVRNEKGEKLTMDNYPISTAILHKKPVVAKLHFLRESAAALPLSTTVAPIIFQDNMIGIIATFRDITEDEKIDRAKSEFVSLASHQLQTPLTAIRWFLEILMTKEKLTKRQRDYVKKSSISTQRMIRLVEDFLNVSRLESGSISVIPKEADFVEFSKGIIQEAGIIAKERNQKIVFKSKNKKINASFDSNLVGQIILNLLSNAIHYSPDNGTVYILLSKMGDDIQIEVKDNGLGIAREDQKKLFTKFFRTRKSAQISTNGSGLGLYIIKKILDTIGGKIRCESEEGKGSNFIVTLPIKSITIRGGKNLIQKNIG